MTRAPRATKKRRRPSRARSTSHRRRKAKILYHSHDAANRRSTAERSDLDLIGTSFRRKQLDLARYHSRRDPLDIAHRRTVLRDNLGDGRISIDPERGKGLQVGLNSGAPAGVAPRDGKDYALGLTVNHNCACVTRR